MSGRDRVQTDVGDGAEERESDERARRPKRDSDKPSRSENGASEHEGEDPSVPSLLEPVAPDAYDERHGEACTGVDEHHCTDNPRLRVVLIEEDRQVARQNRSAEPGTHRSCGERDERGEPCSDQLPGDAISVCGREVARLAHPRQGEQGPS